MVVAADRFARLAHRRAAELAAPDHQRVVEQAAPLQILDEGGAGLIDLAADFLDGAVRGSSGAAVMVPVGVDELHEAHAALDQPAGQQAVVGERRPARLDAVEPQRLGGFAAAGP